MSKETQCRVQFLHRVVAFLVIFSPCSTLIGVARALESAQQDLAAGFHPGALRPRSCLHGHVSYRKALPNVFYISNIESGGSRKYLDDLITHYSVYGINFTPLSEKASVAATSFREHDILLFSYVLFTDYTFRDVQSLVRNYKLRLIIAIHDKYMLNDDPEADYLYKPLFAHQLEATKLPLDKFELMRMAEKIIFPSQFIRDAYAAHLQLSSMVVVPYVDYKLDRFLFVPPIYNDSINLAVITEFTFYKGSNLLERLFHRHHSYRAKEIRFHVYSTFENAEHFQNVIPKGKYAEEEIYSRLVDDNIHGLLFLNNYPETHSYALTKGLNSGLPILYSCIGAVSERISKEVEHVEKYFGTDNDAVDMDEKFYSLLDFILTHAGRGQRPHVRQSALVGMPKFYDELFFESSSEILRRVHENHDLLARDFARAHSMIEPYAVYFPQFHPIPENDVNFYPGYTDMANLVQAKPEDSSLLTPLKNVLGFYDLAKDTSVVPTQVKLAKSFGFYGFALYYYWFSTNTVTGKHMLFQKATTNSSSQTGTMDSPCFLSSATKTGAETRPSCATSARRTRRYPTNTPRKTSRKTLWGSSGTLSTLVIAK